MLRYLSASVTLLRPRFLAAQMNESSLKIQRAVHFKVEKTSVCHAVCAGFCGALERVLSDIFLRCIGGLFLLIFGVLLSLSLAIADDEMDEIFWEGVGGCDSLQGTKLYLEMFPEGSYVSRKVFPIS